MRSSFARKFDPIRLGLEHEALRREQIDAVVPNDAIRPVVDLAAPDSTLASQISEQFRRLSAAVDQALVPGYFAVSRDMDEREA